MKINKLIEKHQISIIKMALDAMVMPVVMMVLIMSITVLGLVLIPGVGENGEATHLRFSEAFYFMLYTATTIGYGEITNFTYTQQLWVIFSIVLSVVGWFYLLSSVVRLMTNKIFQEKVKLKNKILEISKIRNRYILMVNYRSSYDLFINKIVERGVKVVILVEEEGLYKELKMKYPSSDIIILNLEIISQETMIAVGIEKGNLTDIIVSMEDTKKVFDLTMLIKSYSSTVVVTAFSRNLEEWETLTSFDIENVISSRRYIASDIFNLIVNQHLAEIGEFIHGELAMEDFAKIRKKENRNILIIGGGHIADYMLNRVDVCEDINLTIIDKKLSVSKKIEQYKKDIKFIKADLMTERVNELVDLKQYDCALILLGDDYLNVYINKQIKEFQNIDTIVRLNKESNSEMMERDGANKIFAIDKIQSIEIENMLTKPDILEYRNMLFLQNEEYIEKYYDYMKENMYRKEIKEVVIDMSNAKAVFKSMNYKTKINLRVLLYDLENMQREEFGIIPLCIIKREIGPVLIPFFEIGYAEREEYMIERGDKIIYVSKEERDDYIFKFILENENEFKYALEYYRENN